MGASPKSPKLHRAAKSVKFKTGCQYRHANPATTLCLKVLYIYRCDARGTKMKVQLVHPSGRVQLLGSGRKKMTVNVTPGRYDDWVLT